VTTDADPHAQRAGFLAGAADAWYERNRDAGSDGPLAHFDRLVAAHLRSDGALLEVGCADGARLRRLDDMGPSQSWLAGVEPSARAVTAGRTADPRLDLRVGTADDLPFADQSFDTIVLGFCLYLCDPALLPRIVHETDRTLRDGGTLAIVDFDPPSPRRREYRHQPGLWSHKMDYAAPFLAFPAYSLAEVSSVSHGAPAWSADESERVALKVLKKTVGGGFVLEPDDAS
jgi:SAM-dependent methyltransferase